RRTPSAESHSSFARSRAATRGRSAIGDRIPSRRKPGPACRPNREGRSPAARARATFRRNSWQSSARALLADLECSDRCEVALDELPVLLRLEVLLDDLAGASEGEVDRFTPKLRDRLVLLCLDVSARAIEHVLLFLARLFDHVRSHLLRDSASFRDELLSVVASAFDLRLVLAQQRRRGVAISLCGVYRFLKCALTILHRLRQRPERVLRQHEHEH